jgi:hypothetical protein
MAKKLSETTWQRVRSGVVSAALLKPVVDQFFKGRKTKKSVAKFVAQMPLSEDQLEQIDRMAKLISARMVEMTEQAQKTLRKTDRRVWWVGGIALGFVTAGAITFSLVRRRMAQVEEIEEAELIILPDASANNGFRSPIDQLKNAVSRLGQRQPQDNTQAQTTTANTLTGTALQDNPADQAPFVGNAHTMVYHPADSAHLPAEENRVYFRSQAEAEAAGYRPAVGEGQ